MASDPRTVYAEPNFTTDAPEDSRWMRGRGDNDPTPSPDPAAYRSQYAVGALNLTEGQKVTKGDAGTVVAVLDTGVDLRHSELVGSLVPGFDFAEKNDTNGPMDEGDGVDNDGDTRVDEATGHGTHVAGIVHLTAPDAKIMPLRVLDSDGTGNVFLIAEAAQYAVNNGADVINMSFGSSRESRLIADIADDLSEDDDQDALENVPDEGVVVVGSAGNDNVDVPEYPAASDGVLSVTSVNQDETKSDFANYDNVPYTAPETTGWIDVAAPGDDIHSLFPTNQYAEWDGTSMAAPFVAGQAALLRSLDPTLPAAGPEIVGTPGPDSVEDAIKSSARSLDAKNPTYAQKLGAGHADACASVKYLQQQNNAGCPTSGTEEPPPDTGEPQPNAAPVIWDPRPVPGSATRDRTPVIAAKISDAQTDLAKSDVRLFLDGRERGTFSYDNAENNRLIFASGRLGYGGHRAIIVAEDPEGLVIKKAWSFRVVR